jgi:polygalacturonase
MNLTEAIEVLKTEKPLSPIANEAVETIKTEIENCSAVSISESIDCSPLGMLAAKLVGLLLNSTNPAFSYQILRALIESIVLGKTELEDDFSLKGLFINKQLGSETVHDGLRKCMVALGNCTNVTGEVLSNA